MPKIVQIRLSGFGGQGIILAGMLLGLAGVIDKKHVAESSSYGAQARGSGCKSEVVFSDVPIDFPHLTIADILVAMSQGAYDDYYGDVKAESGLIFYDEGQVVPKDELGVRQIGIPATEHAVRILKNGQVANIVLLGAIIEKTKIVSLKAIQKAIRTQVSERFLSLNLKALLMGTKLGRKIRG